MRHIAKRFTLIFLAMIVLLSIIEGSAEKYRYADRWTRVAFFHIYECEFVEPKEDARLNELLYECKEMISTTLKRDEYTYFNWEAFEEVEIYYSNGITFNHSEERFSGVRGFYSSSVNSIGISTKRSNDSDERMKCLITHELFHCLTTTEKSNNKSEVMEGIADYYTRQVLQKHGIWYEFYYTYEENFVEWIQLIFGEKQTAEMICQGTLDKTIDKYSKIGMSNVFEDVLMTITNYDKVYDDTDNMKMLIWVEQDILCHMAANYSKNLDEANRKVFLSRCEEMLISDDEEQYFRKLLE